MAPRSRPLALLVATILLVSLWACDSPSHTAYPLASTTLSLSLPNDPYLLVDSNNPPSGPQVGLAYAIITNTGAATAHDVYMYIGNGATPGTFAPGSDGNSLSTLGGVADATRFIVDLSPGQSKTVYWMLTYPLNDGETYPMTIWANSADGDFVQGSHTYAVQSTISAAADKILGTVTVDPPSGIVSLGNILTVTVSGFNLGTIGQQGDAWFQPVGNIDFSPDCFRLVRSEVYIHSIANQCGYGAMPYIDQLYFPGIRTCYSNDLTDYVKYYFVALQECTTTMKVYQKAASGAVQKYSGDFGVAGATLTTTSQGGSVTIAKSVSPSSGGATTTCTWTITYTNNSDYPVGDPQNGNGLVLIDEAVPSYTTYVAGSSNCSGYSCVKYYSTDNGASWNQTEPVPASLVDKLKWYINQTIPAHSSGTVSFQSKVNSGVPGTPVICNSASAQIDDGAPMGADGVCANGGVDLELSKVVDDPTPCEGSSVTYTVTVNNPSAANATNVQVADLLPTGLAYDSSVPSQGSYNNVSGLWTVGSVSAGANATLLLAAIVNPGTGGQIITNTANITHVDQTDPLVTNNSDDAGIFVPSSVAMASANSPVCEGATIELYGGPGGMSSYSWTGPNGFSSTLQNPTISAATSLDAGTYYLTVTNGNCTGDPASTEVVVNPKPTADAGGDTGFCASDSVQLGGSASGGTSPYTYDWTGPESHPNTQNPTVSAAGTYTLTVTDNNGCSDTDDVIVSQYLSPTADAGTDKQILCGTGSVLIGGSPTASGGTSPYTYQWAPDTGLDDTAIANPSASAAGTYTVTVTDANGCRDTDSVTVAVIGGPTANAGGDTGFCASGSVQLSGSATGGTSPYTYDWTGPENHPNTQNPTVSMAGTYTLNVTDDNGCSDTDDVIVSQYPSLTADAGANAVIISGESVVIGGTPTASGGTPLYAYSWTPTVGLNNATAANPTASPAVNTTYTVTVTDSNGCTDSDEAAVTVIQDCCICGFVYRAGTMEPLAGWEVILEKQTNPWVQVGSATTDASGKYCFCGLGSGYYRVSEVVQPGWDQVTPLPNEYLVALPGGCCDPQTGPFLIFENQQGGPSTVGWEASPIDKLAILAPLIVLLAAIVAGASLLALRRRRA
jgi:uncharacterized repeat protein (TIGR01451 family)